MKMIGFCSHVLEDVSNLLQSMKFQWLKIVIMKFSECKDDFDFGNKILMQKTGKTTRRKGCYLRYNAPQFNFPKYFVIFSIVFCKCAGQAILLNLGRVAA